MDFDNYQEEVEVVVPCVTNFKSIEQQRQERRDEKEKEFSILPIAIRRAIGREIEEKYNNFYTDAGYCSDKSKEDFEKYLKYKKQANKKQKDLMERYSRAVEVGTTEIIR